MKVAAGLELREQVENNLADLGHQFDHGFV